MISQWFREQKNANYGIRTGSVNNLYVVDLDGPSAQAWWKSTGFPDGAIITTPSGPDRTHHYFRIDGEVELPNTKKALHEAVDTRGEGGLVAGPGSMLATGTYWGDLRNIPPIPDGLLAILPEKQEYTTEYREGEKVEAASESESRQIAAAIESLDNLPRVWSEGAGWRSEMYRVACWFIRMVNSPDYAMTENGALGIILKHTPTDEVWGQRDIMEQWESAKKTVGGQQATLPTESIPNLLPLVDVLSLLPEYTTADEAFTTLVFETPEGEAADFWKARRTLLVECFRAGLTAQQAVTVAWNAVSGRPLQSDMNGLPTLWKEAEKARASVAAELGTGFEAPADDERPKLSIVESDRITLLSPEERDWLAMPSGATSASGDALLNGDWWGTRYLEWAASRVALLNAPYHRMNVWTILSLVFADTGFLPDIAKPIGLNLFSIVLGKSTTGKSESTWLMNSVITACFPKADQPNIGGNASPNALIEKLIERDGKPSLFITDEAHGIISQMQGENSWMSPMKELLADLYEGKVPIILRNGKKDLSGVNASTFFTTHLMGTVDGLTKVIDEAMWTSGLLPRFIWAVGADIEPTEDTYAFRQVEAYSAGTYDAMPKQWAAEFANTKEKLKAFGTLPLAILHEQAAADRHEALQRQLGKLARDHRQIELLKPTLIRFGINLRKCAILVALVEGSSTVSLRHELIALDAGEEWLNNIFAMAEATTATQFSRYVDDIERFIASQKNQEVRMEKIYGHFKVEYRYTDERVLQLVKEGRVSRTDTKDGSFLLKIKRQQQIGAIAA